MILSDFCRPGPITIKGIKCISRIRLPSRDHALARPKPIGPTAPCFTAFKSTALVNRRLRVDPLSFVHSPAFQSRTTASHITSDIIDVERPGSRSIARFPVKTARTTISSTPCLDLGLSLFPTPSFSIALQSKRYILDYRNGFARTSSSVADNGENPVQLESCSIPVTDPIHPTVAPGDLIRSKLHPGFRQRIESH